MKMIALVKYVGHNCCIMRFEELLAVVPDVIPKGYGVLYLDAPVNCAFKDIQVGQSIDLSGNIVPELK